MGVIGKCSCYALHTFVQLILSRQEDELLVRLLMKNVLNVVFSSITRANFVSYDLQYVYLFTHKRFRVGLLLYWNSSVVAPTSVLVVSFMGRGYYMYHQL